MPETSTEKLAEDVDTAIRDVYHALRTALHGVEDLKMRMIRQSDVQPFRPEHDEMYKMYLNLSKRFQEMREEVGNHSDPGQSQPPTPARPAPHTDEPHIGKLPFPRSKSRPYVLVPVGPIILHREKAILIHRSHEVQLSTLLHHHLMSAPIDVNGRSWQRQMGLSKANAKRRNQRVMSPPILKVRKVRIAA